VGTGLATDRIVADGELVPTHIITLPPALVNLQRYVWLNSMSGACVYAEDVGYEDRRP
jgi:hypothetical protein